MIQVLSCILLFFPGPLHLLFIRLSYHCRGGSFTRSCAPVRGRVLNIVLHPKMQQSLSCYTTLKSYEYSRCPVVVGLLQSITMTLAPLLFFALCFLLNL